MHIPPMAGAITVSILDGRLFFRAVTSFSAFFGCSNTLAHCIYCLLCKPDVSLKCPSCKTPISFINSIISCLFISCQPPYLLLFSLGLPFYPLTLLWAYQPLGNRYL